MHERSMNKKDRPRYYTQSLTAQDGFRPIPGLVNCAGMTVLGDETAIRHANALRWLASRGILHRNAALENRFLAAFLDLQ